uniref:Glycosyltransferase family 92 protein n=1 Tax=Caenorhabditis tropicalis TaxID=1561998 RepID=A0A1I7TYC7_9PELO
MFNSELRLLNAYLYKDFIAITTTVQHKTGQSASCRYFDCNQQEIPNSTWQSSFFPLNTVYCVRRAGAKYVSISYQDGGFYAKPPVPLIFRAFDEPIHELGMCVGPFYGPEKRWLTLIEFVEHMRIYDVSMFYFTIFDIDGYSRLAMDEYERQGLAETTVIQTEYEQLDWMFHLIQLHDCFHRSRSHSKWVINADIDERFVMLQPDQTLIQLLRSQNENVGELNFQARRIQKTQSSPEKFTNLLDAIENLEALKFKKTAKTRIWESSKSIYRPEKVAVQTYHHTHLQYPGVIVKNIPRDVAMFRHYRVTTVSNSIGNGWIYGDNFTDTGLEPELEKLLVSRVVNMISLSLFSIVPLIILCGKKGSKNKTLSKNQGNPAPVVPPPQSDAPKSVEPAAPQEAPKTGEDSKAEKPNNEMSINAAFEMNKGEKSTTASVFV